MSNEEQYLRKFQLILFDNDLNGIDLSELRCKFSIKRTDVMTPNVADIRIYNLEEKTALKIFSEYSPFTNGQGQFVSRGSVIMQAGYESNYGTIFQGNIKQIIIGRESATDTFIDVICGDGERAYNYSIVNKSLAAGSSQLDQLNAAAQDMGNNGVGLGYLTDMPLSYLPRTKVMYGASKDYLRDISQSTNTKWSIQDEKINFIKKESYLPGERVVLTSKTGMIGTPNQTNQGVQVKCLLNPFIKVSGQIQIDNASVAKLAINFAVKGSPANAIAPLSADGVYYNLIVEHEGDTRGVAWYTNILGVILKPEINPLNTIKVGF